MLSIAVRYLFYENCVFLIPNAKTFIYFQKYNYLILM